MPQPTAPRPRWSKRTDELVHYVAQPVRPGLQVELAHWIEDSARFQDFVTANRDKIRKKLSGSSDEEYRLDVRAELFLAHALLADRRFEVAFETYGAGRVGPDLTVTFRANQRFNVEVTRMHLSDSADAIGRVANVIAGKLRQLPTDAPNALVIAASGASADDVAAAMRALKARIDAKDDAYFARRRLASAREASAQWLRLGGVMLLETGAFEPNREAKRPIPIEALAAIRDLTRPS